MVKRVEKDVMRETVRTIAKKHARESVLIEKVKVNIKKVMSFLAKPAFKMQQRAIEYNEADAEVNEWSDVGESHAKQTVQRGGDKKESVLHQMKDVYKV